MYNDPDPKIAAKLRTANYQFQATAYRSAEKAAELNRLLYKKGTQK